MKKFHAHLNELNHQLNLPQPTKSRVLLEIASDLEDSYSFYKNQGLSDSEALQKAQERFSIDERTLVEIEAVHRSFFSRWLESLSERTRITWERILLVLLTLVVVISGLFSSVSHNALFHAGYYAYILLVIFASAMIISLQKFYQFYLKKDHRLFKIRKNLALLLSLSALSLLSGLFVYYLELFTSGTYLYILETKMLSVIFPLDQEYLQVMKEMIEWTIRGSSIMMLSMLVSIMIALFWFFFINRAIKIEQAEISYLLTE